MNTSESMKILIPLDGSPIGESVLESLMPLIRSRRIESTLFHVPEAGESLEKARAWLEARRQGLDSRGVTVKVSMGPGRATEEILRKIREGGFDLVAMATHARTGMERVRLGSVAEDVVRSSPVPTLLCKAGGRVGDWERILVALDGSPGAEEVLGDVVRLAASLKAEVHLVKVDPGLLLEDQYRGVGFRFEEHAGLPYLEEIAREMAGRGVMAFPEKRRGFPATEIAHLAQELDAGLICMTTEGRPETSPGLNQSVAAQVIRTAPCPVYVRHMTGAARARGSRRKPTEAR